MIDVALIGCGHMGAHHAAVIARDPRCRLVAAVDIVPERAERVAARYGAQALREPPEHVSAAVVATPTHTHLEVAAPLLRAGAWCLVEKPLACTSAAARQVELSKRLVVGHIERFNPAVRSAVDVRPQVVEARRLAPPSGRNQDVDVVLDLMVHDLDLVLSWDDEVEWLDAVGVAVLGDRIDTASVRLRTAGGMTASLLASRVAATAERTLRLYEDGRYTSLDLLKGVATSERGTLHSPDPRDALTAQWDAFIDAVQDRAPVCVSARQGLRAVELAERIGQLIAAG